MGSKEASAPVYDPINWPDLPDGRLPPWNSDKLNAAARLPFDPWDWLPDAVTPASARAPLAEEFGQEENAAEHKVGQTDGPLPKSFTSFGQYGFWARDSFLEDWLRRLVTELDTLPSLPPWLKEARDYWNVRATMHFNGTIDCQFDEYLNEPGHLDVILAAAAKIQAHAALTRGERATADLFAALLRGQLKTTAASPLDYFPRD